MAFCKGICKLTNKEETIWFDMIAAGDINNPKDVIVGLMNDCSVKRKLGIALCKECNIYKELPHGIKYQTKKIYQNT